MNTIMLNVPIQSDTLLALNQTPEELINDLKLWAAIGMYQCGKISLARAASLANQHRYDFENLLTSLNIPISKLNEDDADKELNLLDELL